MTTRLRVYNGALLLCGETRLASLDENREARYALDEVWNNGGAEYCLEQGQWKFATRTSKFTYDAAIAPDFGYRRGFTKPSDWLATSALCTDEYLNSPLLDYADEAGFWYADYDDLYIAYVSNDADFGGDLTKWPATFADYVSAHFAYRVLPNLTGANEDRLDYIRKEGDRRLLAAKNADARSGPTKFPAPGRWVLSRRGGGRGGPLGDRGSSGSLTG